MKESESNAEHQGDEGSAANNAAAIHEAVSVRPDSAAVDVAVADTDDVVNVEAAPDHNAELAKLKDQLLRTAADFDNYRKRTRRDLEDAQRRGLEKALLEVLPVSDNLGRAVSAATSTSDVTSLIEGVRMVLRSLDDAFVRLGVTRVEAVGHGFDPGLHEAIQQVPTSEHAPGTVVSELMPGYRLGPKLLRAAMVAVAAPAPGATAQPAHPSKPPSAPPASIAPERRSNPGGEDDVNIVRGED